MPSELGDYGYSCFEQNCPSAIVIGKNRDMKNETLKKRMERVVQRPKTPPLEQADMFEGVAKKGRKSRRRKAKKKPGYYYEKRIK